MFELQFVLDYESNKNKLSAQTITAIAKAFMEELQRYTDRVPMLYTYPAFIGNFSGLNQYHYGSRGMAMRRQRTPLDGGHGNFGTTVMAAWAERFLKVTVKWQVYPGLLILMNLTVAWYN
ncbi:hypothetical protein GRF59_09455 [Paenibacillus sp. HJL G12]|uniref:Uncharacterized protein n=1 Tax=Paenibacillus dendrobii TaxID=2691084 RepID=A0A7X3IJQ1_9BACL|nr:hypothetical protein [Paenibacillus dendrobii]